jgi:hypothetical protein
MSHIVYLHPGAEADLIEAVAWYESRSQGLGRVVLLEFRRLVERLCLFPEAYRQIRPGIRQASLTRLPLNVIYSPLPDAIAILMIPDPRRDPAMTSRKIDERSRSSPQ